MSLSLADILKKNLQNTQASTKVENKFIPSVVEEQNKKEKDTDENKSLVLEKQEAAKSIKDDFLNPDKEVSGLELIEKVKKKVTAERNKETNNVQFTARTLENNIVVKDYNYAAMKKTSTTIVNYVPNIEKDIIIFNKLQKDATRTSNVHLWTIAAILTDTPYSQVKLPSLKWVVKFDKNQAMRENDNTKFLNSVGITYDLSKQEILFNKDSINLEYLNSLTIEELQEKYDKLLEAALTSHVLNSKNNLFSKTDMQSSAFMIEINNIMSKVSLPPFCQ